MLNIGHNRIRSTAATGIASSAAVPVAALALLHCLLYVWLVPAWQMPDEPTQFEYAALVAMLGRTPRADDHDVALDQRLTASLVRSYFFPYLTGKVPATPPQTLAEAREIVFMPSQLGGDPPLYFWVASLPLRMLAGRSIETQLLALRLLGALCTCGAAVCAYGAARELFSSGGYALTVGLVVALQPMFAFIGAGAGNDSMANLGGAAITWLLVDVFHHGVNARRGVLLAGLVVLGVMTKRTLLPHSIVIGALALGWASWKLVRLPHTTVGRVVVGVLVLALLLLGGGAAVLGGRAPGQAADWVVTATGSAAARTTSAPASGQPALVVQQGQQVIQELPDSTAEWAQNNDLHLGARVWSAQRSSNGILLIDIGWATLEQPFQASRIPTTVQFASFIPLYCPYVHVGVRSLDGTLYVDRFSADSDRRRGVSVITNGDFRAAAMVAGTPAEQVRRFGRLRDLDWIWRSGRLESPPPLGWDLARIFFASFWGQFGWMSLPLVGNTPWEAALALFCGGGLLGALGWLFLPGQPPWQRQIVGVLLAVLIVGILMPLLNSYIQPRNQAIQQGRYLFPALAPLAMLLVLGWQTLLPQRWHRGGAVIALLAALALAGAALHLIVQVYG